MMQQQISSQTIFEYSSKNKNKLKIAILDGFAVNSGDLSWDIFHKYGDLAVFDRTPHQLVVSRAKDADVIFVNKLEIRKDVIDQLPQTKLINVMATGFNIVDVEYARKRNITVCNVPGYSAESVAQLVFSFILNFARQVQFHSDQIKQHHIWQKSADFSLQKTPQMEIAGKVLGIVGFGTIGQTVARIAQAFQMKVIVHTRTERRIAEFPNLQYVSKKTVFQESDFLSLHCPLTKESENFVDCEALSAMKKTAFIINTSRGQCVNEQDLADALNENAIAGAGLDVLVQEPPVDGSPLLLAKNCAITPHYGWATKEARTRLINILSDNVSAFIQGKPINVVN